MACRYVILVTVMGLSGCGIIFDGPGSDVGGTSSGGGTPGTSSVVSSSSASSSSGAPGEECSVEVPCPDGKYCDFPDGLCGKGEKGACLPMVATCTDECPGVCGCDGVTYCSDCLAKAAGVDVATSGCEASAAKYSAEMWSGGLDHLTLRKADPVKDVCIEIHIDAPMENQSGFDFTTPEGWGVVTAQAIQPASACDDSMPGPGLAVGASGGQGVVTFEVGPGGWAPCKVTIQATLSFDSPPAWLGAAEVFDAAFVQVEGGCW